MTWIKLHRPDMGEVWVCSEQIQYVMKGSYDEEKTEICFGGNTIYVSEPLEEVMDRLRRLSAS